jgi:hypothetical protein
MHVFNRHERALDCDPAELAPLIDGLSSEDDRLWPTDPWPAMFFDRPLEVGAVGGHGVMKYEVEQYEPGSAVRFRYLWPSGFDGFHEYTVHPGENGGSVLRHTLDMVTKGLSRPLWSTYVRPLHDACLEDSLDRAEAVVSGQVAEPAHWSSYVKLLYKSRNRRQWP